MWCCTVYWYGSARTAAERMCDVARYNNISSKADRGDIFIRAAAEQMGGFNCKKSECDVTWPSTVTHTLNSGSAFNPSKVHTQWTHTHTPWTHTRSSGQPVLRRPGSRWGFGVLLKGTSVVVLKVERALYIPTPHQQFTTCGLRVQLSTIRPQLPPLLCPLPSNIMKVKKKYTYQRGQNI